MASLKLGFSPQTLPIFLFFSVFLTFFGVSIHALNIGIQTAGTSIQVSKACSRKCESEFCSVPPFLRYGKYCGLLYSGCPGETPCDGLDACCMRHDACVQRKGNDYLSQQCSQQFINCMDNFSKSGGHTFKGSTCQADDVIEIIKVVMEAALLAGRVFHNP